MMIFKKVYNLLSFKQISLKLRCRKLSYQGELSPIPSSSSTAHFSKEEYDEYMSVYPQIVEDITSIEPYNKLPNFTSSVKKMLDYNATTGTNTSGLYTIYAYKMMAKPEQKIPENIRLAIILGWCMRLYEASVYLLDDLLDNSPQRYWQPSWYSLPNIGKNAAIHSIFTEKCIYYLLKKYIMTHPQYENIQQLFSESAFHFNISFYIDVLPYDERNMTQEYLNVAYFGKAAFTTVNTQVLLAMYLADIRDQKIRHQLQKVSTKIGVYWQIQNDFLDSFEEPKKPQLGTDIKESRITWLSVTAYNKCNPVQKKLFRDNYGNVSTEAVNKIIDLYKELEMPKVYEETTRKFQEEILEDIRKLPNDIIPHELFYRLMSNIQQKLCTTTF